MVVYCVPEQARKGGGAQQSIIAQGEPVREGQQLLQIPDLRHMRVNARVHEALVASVRPAPEQLRKFFGRSILRRISRLVATMAMKLQMVTSLSKCVAWPVRF